MNNVLLILILLNEHKKKNQKTLQAITMESMFQVITWKAHVDSDIGPQRTSLHLTDEICHVLKLQILQIFRKTIPTLFFIMLHPPFFCKYYFCKGNMLNLKVAKTLNAT